MNKSNSFIQTEHDTGQNDSNQPVTCTVKESSNKKCSTIDPVPSRSHKNSNYQFESNRKYFSISIYALCVILIGTLFIYCIINMDKTKGALSHFLSSLTPFIAAFFIAYILNPIVVRCKSFLENVCHIRSTKISKILSIVFTYILVISILTVTLLYIIPEVGKSITELSYRLQDTGEMIVHNFQQIEELFPNLDLSAFEEKISGLMVQLVSFGPNMVKQIVPLIYNFSMSIVRLVINLLLSIVISIYMLSDKNTIGQNMVRLLYAFFRKTKVDNFIENCKECNTIFSAFIVGKSLDSLIIGIICFILMTILKLPYSVLLSVIVGITNMIPYFGPFIGAIPGVVLFLVISPFKAIIFAIMILALQQFDGLILGPKILGESTGLKPLWVILAITLGGAYAGVLGMFLGVPVVAVIAFLLNKSITARLEKKNIHLDE